MVTSVVCLPQRRDDLVTRQLDEMSDELLVPLAQSGEPVAFVELVKRHGEKIKARICLITRNWEDAEDVFQEAILRAFIHIRSFEGRSSFSTWLTRIAINAALMRLRRKCASELPLQSQHDSYKSRSSWEPIDTRDTPEEGLVKREREKLLSDAILQLPLSLRVVVQMYRAQRSTSRDIASALGISVQAVKSRLSRARVLLRLSVLKSGPGEPAQKP